MPFTNACNNAIILLLPVDRKSGLYRHEKIISNMVRPCHLSGKLLILKGFQIHLFNLNNQNNEVESFLFPDFAA
jgi:hypothetical protein